MNADGSAPRQVTQNSTTDVRAQWLPDGSGLVFNREHDGQIELWQVPVPKTP
jgi:Tol biopolymer transport system component